ncbi:hypothetical protein BU24DRAFT_2987 [Aaosphaeria arxii CBS 175.79]|uniref:Uncharacterized protein n=1 Tax=Aaosphaeria arxii CBS 175.79 TaxID=1450172 RepID=A0A6A5Y5K5_9PLEO|nr:uncharacterized protein BU24DRAFT_2987 [Aaosphaeria arxii CBS 175.79]KAF2020559.1 hypothetical protein BU24DRAFT_2987 [Aaosphaeria arxii CBS 175.79]
MSASGLDSLVISYRVLPCPVSIHDNDNYHVPLSHVVPLIINSTNHSNFRADVVQMLFTVLLLSLPLLNIQVPRRNRFSN